MGECLKKLSKKTWTTDNENGVTNDDLKTGAILRIADSVEVMAQNYNKMQTDLEMYKRWYQEERESGLRMSRRISALQGVITKLKKKQRP